MLSWFRCMDAFRLIGLVGNFKNCFHCGKLIFWFSTFNFEASKKTVSLHLIHFWFIIFTGSKARFDLVLMQTNFYNFSPTLFIRLQNIGFLVSYCEIGQIKASKAMFCKCPLGRFFELFQVFACAKNFQSIRSFTQNLGSWTIACPISTGLASIQYP